MQETEYAEWIRNIFQKINIHKTLISEGGSLGTDRVLPGPLAERTSLWVCVLRAKDESVDKVSSNQ